MIESIDPKEIDKPVVRCSKCDRDVDHYNAFLDADNRVANVCWQCLQREEKGFFTKRDFRRQSRSGVIPR